MKSSMPTGKRFLRAMACVAPSILVLSVIVAFLRQVGKGGGHYDKYIFLTTTFRGSQTFPAHSRHFSQRVKSTIRRQREKCRFESDTFRLRFCYNTENAIKFFPYRGEQIICQTEKGGVDMLNAAFIYDYENKEWVRCTDAKLIDSDIEKLPYVLLAKIKYYASNSTELRVFCPQHKTMESVVSIVKNHVVSCENCEFDGLLGYREIEIGYTGRVDNQYVPFRWRIFQRSPGAPLNVACDALKVDYDRGGVPHHWENLSFSIDVVKRKLFVRQLRGWRNNFEDWTELTDVEIPQPIVDIAIDAMRESIGLAYGIKPSVLSRMTGQAKIRAFVERPFDLNIVYLKTFLQQYIDNDFDKVFPYELKDNYRKICALLDIKPPKSLRKAYAYNPYAVVWYMIFLQLGVKDVNYMQKFFYWGYLADFFIGKFHFNIKSRRAKISEQPDYANWLALEFYCRWLIKNKGEKHFMQWLHYISVDAHITGEQWDTIRSFYRYAEHLSDEIKARLLEDGLTQYVHDIISFEVTALAKHWSNVRLNYNEKILAYECKINDYEFHLVHETDKLPKIGFALENCVATYREQVVRHHSIIVYVMHNGEYAACIELQNERNVVQALGKHNARLSGKLHDVCCLWLRHHKLYLDCHDLTPHFAGDEQDKITAEPLPYKKTMQEMNLPELQDAAEYSDEEGYYLRLVELLCKEYKYSVAAPQWMNFADEKSSLMYTFPQGKRIYEAAFDGNVEGMRALGFLYYRGKCLRHDCDKALKWFKQAADLGCKQASREADKLQQLLNNGIAARDVAIMRGLHDLRRYGYVRTA